MINGGGGHGGNGGGGGGRGIGGRALMGTIAPVALAAGAGGTIRPALPTDS